MVYLLKMVIFHGKLLNNQMVEPMVSEVSHTLCPQTNLTNPLINQIPNILMFQKIQQFHVVFQHGSE